MIKPDFLSRFFPEIMIAFALSLLVAGSSYWPVGDPGLKTALLQAVERRDAPQKVLDRKGD